MGVHVFTDRLAFAAADWCFRLHGWPIMPPLVGIFAFTIDRLRRRRLVSSLSLMDDFDPTLATSAIIKGNITKLSHHHFSLYDIFLFLCLTTSTGSPLTSESGAIDVISYFFNNFHNIHLDCLRHNLSTKVPIKLWSSIFLCFPFGLPMDSCLWADS
uniref:HGWP repeat containing protein-like protein n=1 Tax=Oryza sativa subsp. japonica TaxID=39947 RepID=Q69K11_ORYSJ|nr:HGWP repeat containing protein-like protein [Oryza sativa Japonica Group]